MASLNKVQLIGHLGADPEIRTIRGDSRVANLSLATSRQWKDAAGTKQEKTEWHRISVYSPALIDLLEKYAKKGDRLYVCGRLEYSKQGEGESARYFTSIVLSGPQSELILLSARSDGARIDAGASAPRSTAARPAAAAASTRKPTPVAVPAFDGGDDDDDLPF